MTVTLALSAGGSGPSPLWYATRGTGLVAAALLTATVVLGILTNVRFATPRWPRFVTAGLHRNLSLLVLAFLAVHILTAELDTFAPVGWLAVLVPFQSAYRPLWLGLGTLALDLLLAVTITSALRLRLGHRVWRAVHWASYACWPLAMVHGLGTGTDSRLTPALLLNAVCVLVVLGALWWRLAVGWPQQAGWRVGSAALSVLLPVVVVGWALSGPLAPGWARRAGTPPRLVAQPVTSGGSAGSVAGSSAGQAVAAPRHFGSARFAGRFTGSVSQSAANSEGLVAIRIHGRTTGPVPGILDIVLDGRPDGAGGVSMSGSQVSFGPTGRPTLYQGQISALQGLTIQVNLASSAAPAVTLTAQLQLGNTQANGTYTVVPAGGGR